jgi:uncharacterized protein
VGSPEPRTLQVNAVGTVLRAPDRAVVQLAVETLAETAAEASTRNAATMEQVLAALRRAGVPDARIRTTRIELHPRYDHRRPEGPPLLVGYQAVNQVMVRLDELALVGRVVDAGVQAGANRVAGIQFEISDPEAAYHEALDEAIGRAAAEAARIAAALGEPLGPALHVASGRTGPPTPMLRRGMAEFDMAAATPVQPGELEVTATVSITYRLGS